jgi:hydroxyacylglutathione hydrolase
MGGILTLIFLRTQSQSSPTVLMSVRVVPVPALDDNLMYMVIDTATNLCGVVDPVDPVAIQQAASEQGATIVCILTTHSHWDHDGGNIKLAEQCSTIKTIYGGLGDGVAGCTKEVGENDEFTIGETTVRVLFTPCHTPGHVCYLVGDLHVFTGDTLFVSGCGNFNQGTPEQMTSAFDKLMGLPNSTQVWVGHEYTKTNCNFACFIEPNNVKVAERLQWATGQTSIHNGGTGTVPSTIGAEKSCNPFCRLDTRQIMEFCGNCEPRSERMRLVRKGKDDWGAARRREAAAAVAAVEVVASGAGGKK